MKRLLVLLAMISIIITSGCVTGGVDMKKNSVAVFNTDMGTFRVELFEDRMPNTTANFIKLAKDGFYGNTTFHRVIKDFMIQGGDPTGTGTGGPGYTIKDEFVKGLSNVKGTIAMANTGRPDSGGSQFFINLVNNTYLDFDKPPLEYKHPVFGRVIGGMDVVERIGSVQTGQGDKPVKPVVIKSITIE